MPKKETAKKSDIPYAKISCSSQIFHLFAGALPNILIGAVCWYILNKEYVAKGNNFWGKSKFFGLIEKGQYYEEVKCGQHDYTEDKLNFKECAPKHCGRHFTDFVISDTEADMLLSVANRGFQYSTPRSAAIFDLHSGVVSKDDKFMSLKSKLKVSSLLSPEELAGFNVIKDKIKNTIKEKFQAENVYLTKPVFFSQITSKDAVTMNDEYWHSHIDKNQYEGFHYTALIYLNDHQLDYTGGRFFWTNNDNTTLSFEPKKARLSVFTSGSENVHNVEKVKTGTRYAITIPFTCNKNLEINIK